MSGRVNIVYCDMVGTKYKCMQTVSNQRRPDSRWGVVRFKAWDLGILVWKFLPQAMTATARVKCDGACRYSGSQATMARSEKQTANGEQGRVASFSNRPSRL